MSTALLAAAFSAINLALGILSLRWCGSESVSALLALTMSFVWFVVGFIVAMLEWGKARL